MVLYGPYGPFYDIRAIFVEMLLLLQIVLYNVEGMSQWCSSSAFFRVFRNFGSMVPHGPYGPFYEITQTASSLADYVLEC